MQIPKLNVDLEYYQSLLDRLTEGKLSPSETVQLIDWINDESCSQHVANLINKHLQNSSHELDLELALKLKHKLPAILGKKEKQEKYFHINQNWLKYAAVFIIVISTAFFYHIKSNRSISSVAQIKNTLPEVDITHGENSAVLTLADGRKILLDSANNGLIALQNGSQVILKNGELVYNSDNKETGEVDYNTIHIPNGRQIQLSLADGTKVWLNAESSLQFPTAFSAAERRVSIVGEGFFEVAKDKSRPFKVTVGNKGEIEVLGTHFNVSSYANEACIKTTLFEGSVKMIAKNGDGKQNVIIIPGQQARLKDGQLTVVNNVDLNKIVAWKNGFFDFDHATLEDVMHQLERWYNIEVVCEGAVPGFEFVGKIERGLSLQKVLRGLEVSGVHFRLEGKKLIVLK